MIEQYLSGRESLKRSRHPGYPSHAQREDAQLLKLAGPSRDPFGPDRHQADKAVENRTSKAAGMIAAALEVEPDELVLSPQDPQGRRSCGGFS